MIQQNCWEFKKCGREPGGANVGELGICVAYPDHGKDCWTAAGTLCGGKVQGTFAQKIGNCTKCEFYKLANTFDIVVSILAEDLGPSASNLLTKQIKAINKDPANITNGDLDAIAGSVYSGVKSVLGDEIAEKLKKNILMMKA